MRFTKNLICWIAAICFAGSITFATDDDNLSTSTTLKTLKPTAAQVLTAPDGVTGDFDVAKEPPVISFCILPNQWEGARLWSSWGDAAFASDGNFYCSIGDHGSLHGTSYVYRVEPNTGKVDLVVDFNKAAGLPNDPKLYSPGKIHAPMFDSGDGWLYIVGYCAGERGTTDEAGYKGDLLLKYRLADGQIKRLGVAVPYHSVPAAVFHRPTNRLMGLSTPGKNAPIQAVTFYAYDLTTNKVIFHGGPIPEMARTLILADDGSVYYSSEGNMVRYDPKQNQITPIKGATLPGTGGLRAASRPNSQGVAFCFSRDGTIFSFNTKTHQIKQIGSAFPVGKGYTTVCKLSPDERYLYYSPAAHGKTYQSGTVVIQLDVRTGRRKVLAFLHQYLRDQERYHTGGTYSLALNGDGSQLFIGWNGESLDSSRRNKDFGLCSAMILHIPSGER